MVRGININRNLGVALLLGVATLLTNYLSSLFSSSSFFIPIGNIFLFMSAEALGLSGAMIAFAVGIVSESLTTGRHIELLRVLALCAALGYASKKWPRVPGFAVALGLWLFLFGPTLFYLRSMLGTQAELTSERIFFTGLTEVLLVMISGTFLLSSKIWALLCNVPRHTPASSFLVHVITSISTLAMFGALSVTISSPLPESGRLPLHVDLAGLMSILILGITAPAFLAWRLSMVMSRNFQELFSSGFLSGNPNKSFSGLSSEYWRRQSQPESGARLSKEGLNNTLPAIEAQPNTQNKLISPDQGLCTLNRNGTITFVNRRFRKFAGINSNDIIGKQIDSIDMNAALRAKILKLLEETFIKGPRISEVKINQLPEKLRFYELKSYKSDAFEGSSLVNGPDSAIITIKDITDRRTVEAHLLQAQKLESLGALVEGIAHSFNNALTSIIGQASFARKTQDDTKVKGALGEILKTAFSAGLVVRQLLDFASGRPSHMRSEQLEKVIGDRIDLLKRIAGDTFELEFISGVTPVNVMCDTNLIMQALTNLILNAKEAYTGKAGKISIALDSEHMDENVSELNPGSRPGDYARLRVKDNGHGMSADILAKAFDPLFTTKASTGHTGLGLSITFAIIRAHDGFLTAESHPEKGTTISLYFPVCEEKAVDEADIIKVSEISHESSLSELMGNKEKILVVEDEKTVRDLLITMLSSLGYNVTSCVDGAEAFDLAKKEQFDLILVDAVLPKLQGTELLIKLKDSGVNTRCILMSGYGAALTLNGPPPRLIYKPFDLDTLGKAVKSSLSLPQ